MSAKDRIKHYFPDMSEYDDYEIDLFEAFPRIPIDDIYDAWKEFSRSRCAGFLVVDDESKKDFVEWIRE